MSTPVKFLLPLLAAAALLLTVAACSPLKAIDVLTPRDTYVLTEDVAYGADPRQQLDVYRPANAHGPAPVVVFFYGGSWNSGNRKEYRFVGEALASRGILTVIADYRLYPQVRYPDFLLDCGAAVAWTVRDIARYGGDPKRLFVMGHSAGAYNAAMVALDDRWLGKAGLSPALLRGWIGLAGPYDFIPIKDQDVRPVFFFPNTPPESQPINHVTAAAPPTLLIASKKDNLVDPVRNTGGLTEKLRQAGVPVQTIYTDHTSHASLVGSLARPLRGLAPTLDDIVGFIDRNSAGAADRGRTQSRNSQPTGATNQVH